MTASMVQAAERAQAATGRPRDEAPMRHYASIIGRYPALTADPGVHSGQPCIGFTRIPVSVVIGYLIGPGGQRLLADYPDLLGHSEGIRQAQAFTLELLGEPAS